MFKVSMLALWLAAVPLDPELGVWAQWGLAGVVVAFVLWADHAREKRMSAALDERAKEQREKDLWIQTVLLSALNRSSAALEALNQHWEDPQANPRRKTGPHRLTPPNGVPIAGDDQ